MTRSIPPESNAKEDAHVLIARLRRDPQDRDALHRLCSHYEAGGDFASLANLLEGWADTAPHPQAAATALERAAEAVLRAGGDPNRAAVLMERALHAEPQRPETLERLTQLLATARDALPLKYALQRIRTRAEELGVEPGWMAELEYRLGQAYVALDRHGRGMLHLRRALELRPDMREAIIAARHLYANAGNHQAMAKLYELEVRATPDLITQVELLTELSELCETMLDDLDGAVLALRRAIRRAPGSTLIMERLAEVLERREARDRTGTDGQRAAELLFQASQSLSPRDAEELLLRCLSLWPQHAQAQTALDRLYGVAPAPAPSHGFAAPEPDDNTGGDRLSGERPRTDPPRDHEVEGEGEDEDAPPARPPQVRLDAWLHGEVLTPLAEDTGELHPLQPLVPSDIPPRPDLGRGPVITLPPPVAVGEPAALDALDVADGGPAITEAAGARESHGPSHEPRRRRASTLRKRLRHTDPARKRADAGDRDSTTSERVRQASSPAPPLSVPPPPAETWTGVPAPIHSTIPPPPPAGATGDSPRPEPRPEPSFIPPPPPPASFVEPLAALRSTPPPAAELAAPVGEPADIVAALPQDGERVFLEVNLGPTTPSNCYVGLSDRILDGGLFLSTYHVLPTNTAVEMLVTLPGGLSTRVHGRVRFVYDPFEFATEGEPGMAVKLERVDRDGLSLLERFAAHRPPLFYED